MSGQATTELLLEDLLQLVATACEVPMVIIAVMGGDREFFKYRRGVQTRWLPRVHAFSLEIMHQYGVFQVVDLTADARFRAHPLVVGAPYARFLAGVPLFNLQGTSIGSLLVLDQLARTLTPQQEQMLCSASRQISHLLEQEHKALARVIPRRTQRDVPKSRRQAAIAQLNWRALSSESLADLFTWTVRHVARALDVTWCRIVEVLPATDYVKVHAYLTDPKTIQQRIYVSLEEDPLLAYTMHQLTPTVVNDLSTEDRFDGSLLVRLHHMRSGICLPIAYKGRTFGAITLLSKHRHTFSRADLAFVQTVADALSMVIERTWRDRTYEVVTTLSRTMRRATSRQHMLKLCLDYMYVQLNSVGIALLLRHEQGLVVVAARGIWTSNQGGVLTDPSTSSLQILRQGQVVQRNAPLSQPDFVALNTPPVAGLLGLPLHIHEMALGVLWVGSAEPITVYEMRLIERIADILTNAIYRVDMHDHTVQLYHEHAQLSAEVLQAKRHLANIVESASDLVIATDGNGEIVTWNRAAEQISGYAREEVIGRNLAELCSVEQQPRMRELLEMSGVGRSVCTSEIDLLDHRDQPIPIAWRFSPIELEPGVGAGVVAVGRDLTEHRKLQAQVFQSAKMASLGVMASGIGHELRNPLGIISANAQLAQDHLGNPSLLQQCLQQIHHATRRAAIIIDSLLTFARPKAVEAEVADVKRVLEATLLIMEYQLRMRGIDFRYAIPPDLPPVIGNGALLQQVVTNLILNACQAMPEGGLLQIEATCEVDWVRFIVRDTGVGILPEHLSRIFDPFFTHWTTGQGTGLGLAVSYSIIQQCGGVIEVQSMPGMGTTFLVRLPVAEATLHQN